jgi:hypothetical protein
MDLRAEGDDVGGLVELLDRVVERRQRLGGVGVDEPVRVVPHRHCRAGVPDLVVGGPPHLVIGRRGDLARLGPRDRPPQGGMEMRAPRRCGSIVAKYCTSQPTQRRRFWQNRSTIFGKWIASRAARR